MKELMSHASNLKVLFVTSEINPFLSGTYIADYVRRLPEVMQQQGMEIRILVPRFGTINERKNRLHEVVRLSGINIAVGEEERPLAIKVASIPQAKLQVYFIDNEDYFHRKNTLLDDNDDQFVDNDERAIFFCKGVIETVRKLGWAPDVVHCHDWMSGLVPLYLKTTYKNDPLFKHSKVVFTVHESKYKQQFDASSLLNKVRMEDIDDSMMQGLVDGNTDSFIRIAAEYSDALVKALPSVDTQIEGLLDDIIKDKNLQLIEDDEFMMERHFLLYEELTEEIYSSIQEQE